MAFACIRVRNDSSLYVFKTRRYIMKCAGNNKRTPQSDVGILTRNFSDIIRITVRLFMCAIILVTWNKIKVKVTL